MDRVGSVEIQETSISGPPTEERPPRQDRSLQITEMDLALQLIGMGLSLYVNPDLNPERATSQQAALALRLSAAERLLLPWRLGPLVEEPLNSSHTNIQQPEFMRRMWLRGPEAYHQAARILLTEAGMRASYAKEGTQIPNASGISPPFPINLHLREHWAYPYFAAPSLPGSFPYLKVCDTHVPFRKIHDILELLQLNVVQIKKQQSTRHLDDKMRFITILQPSSNRCSDGFRLVRWNLTIHKVALGNAPRLFVRGRGEDLIQAGEMLSVIVAWLEDTWQTRPRDSTGSYEGLGSLRWAKRQFE